MPRLVYGLEIDAMSEIWSSAGDPLPPEDPSINLTREGGFSPAMSLPGGPPVPRQLFNWSWRVLFTLGSEINQHGLLEWSDQVNYLHTASVAKNGRAFISLVNSGPGVPIGPQDPELAGQTAWVEILRVGQLRWNDIDGVLTISKGGTGASSADGARNALDAAERGHSHSGFAPDPHTHPTASLDDLFGTLSIGKGGTGADTASGARAALGAAELNHNHAGSELTVVIGAVVWWPGLFSAIPGGWREADGAAISRTTYSVCFSNLGTTWGSGNGTTTFNIPNYRGRVLVGKRAADSVGDTGGARSASLTSANLGSHSHTLIAHSHSTQAHSHSIAAHSHSVSSHSHAEGSHSHALSPHTHGFTDEFRTNVGFGVTTGASNVSGIGGTTSNAKSTGSGGGGATGSASGGSTGSAGGGSTSAQALSTNADGAGTTGSAGGANTGSAGNGTPHENMPPFSVGYWIIKIE